MTLYSKFIDRGDAPQCKLDLRFPIGRDLDVSADAAQKCSTGLPYPAKRCGYYFVACTDCKSNALVTVAGRIDDPRSIKLPCKRN